MRLLITGGTGYLGSHIIRRLSKASGLDLIGVRRAHSSLARLRDVATRVCWYDADAVSLLRIVDESRPDIVLHCATDYGTDENGQAALVEANIAMPIRLLDAAIGRDVKAFININTLLPGNVSAYALSKRQFDEWLRFCSGAVRGVDVAVEHFFGTGGSSKNFLTSLVCRLVRGEARIPLTAGEQIRDFVALDDVVEAVAKVVHYVAGTEGSRGYERFEIGGGAPRTVKETVLSIQRIAGNTTSVLEFGAVPYRRDEPMCITADLTRMREIGWLPRQSFEETITKMVEEERTRLCKPI
jgi:CDP-paratose synthetase